MKQAGTPIGLVGRIIWGCLKTFTLLNILQSSTSFTSIFHSCQRPVCRSLGGIEKAFTEVHASIPYPWTDNITYIISCFSSDANCRYYDDEISGT